MFKCPQKNITKHKNGRNVTSKECSNDSNQNLQGTGVLEHFFYLKITNTQSTKSMVDGSEIRCGVHQLLWHMSIIICRAENTCQVGDPRIIPDFHKPSTSINHVHKPSKWFKSPQDFLQGKAPLGSIPENSGIEQWGRTRLDSGQIIVIPTPELSEVTRRNVDNKSLQNYLDLPDAVYCIVACLYKFEHDISTHTGNKQQPHTCKNGKQLEDVHTIPQLPCPFFFSRRDTFIAHDNPMFLTELSDLFLELNLRY